MLTNQPISSTPTASLSRLQETPVADDTSAEGCPTPLDWKDVLASYQQESEQREVRTSDGSIRVTSFGAGPPLYLLNGFLGDHELFALLAWLLREEHTSIVIDLPVAASRSRSDSAQQLTTHAAHLATVADELGHDQIAMHATSFGCLVAFQALLDFPQRISRASLQGACVARRYSLAERALMSIARRSRKTLSNFRPARFIQYQNHRQWFPPFDVTRWEFYVQHVGQTPVRDLAERARIAGRVDLTDRLSEIATPLLFISCEGDGRLTAAAQDDIARRTTNRTIESLDNCGSIPHVTHPHRLVKLLRQFRDNNPD